VEWLLLVLVVLYLFFVDRTLTAHFALLGVLVAFVGFILVFRYARPLAKQIRLKLTVEILGMLAFLTATLAVADGGRSRLLNLYLLPIVTAALALGKRAAALVVVLVCACYLLLQLASAGSNSFTTEFTVSAVGVLAPFALVAFCTTLLVENINQAKQRI